MPSRWDSDAKEGEAISRSYRYVVPKGTWIAKNLVPLGTTYW